MYRYGGMIIQYILHHIIILHYNTSLQMCLCILIWLLKEAPTRNNDMINALFSYFISDKCINFVLKLFTKGCCHEWAINESGELIVHLLSRDM